MALVASKDFGKLYEVSGAVTETLNLEMDWAFAHAFAGIDFFSDAALENSVDPTGGTVEITARSVVSDRFQPLTNGTIAASSRTVVSFASNTIVVRAVPSSITGGGATHYRLRVAANRS